MPRVCPTNCPYLDPGSQRDLFDTRGRCKFFDVRLKTDYSKYVKEPMHFRCNPCVEARRPLYWNNICLRVCPSLVMANSTCSRYGNQKLSRFVATAPQFHFDVSGNATCTMYRRAEQCRENFTITNGLGADVEADGYYCRYSCPYLAARAGFYTGARDRPGSPDSYVPGHCTKYDVDISAYAQAGRVAYRRSKGCVEESPVTELSAPIWTPPSPTPAPKNEFKKPDTVAPGVTVAPLCIDLDDESE